jgi:hypothetical protein
VTAERDARAALAALDRRAFLRLAGAAAAAGLLPAGCGGVPEVLLPPPGLALRVLSPRSYATFQAAALRLAGPRSAVLVGTGALDPAATADAWLARTPALGAALGQGLALLEWGIWPLVAKLRPFTSLDGEAQDHTLEDLMRSHMDVKRDLFKGLKSLAMLAVYARAAARPLVGYPGPFDRVGIEAAMRGD